MADPEYCDGEGAESFGTLLERVRAALERLEATPDDALVYVFSHGQFIQAVRSLVIDAELSEREKMRQFWGREVRPSRMPSWWSFPLRREHGGIFLPAFLSREFNDRGAVDQGHPAPGRLPTIAAVSRCDRKMVLCAGRQAP